MNQAKSRVDDLGRAYAGSQLQIQIYVNKRTAELSQGVLNAFPSLASLKPAFRWVSPLESQKFAEYQDRAFLKALGLEHLATKLRNFWPKGGPHWDALAAMEFRDGSNGKGILLVEAKSHVSEVYGSSCKASPESREKIETALDTTKEWLGVPKSIDWTGRLYQSANRIAHLFFLREVAKVSAWLVNVYFMNDPHSPTGFDKWQSAFKGIKEELGLTDITIPYTAELFLEAKKGDVGSKTT